MIGRTFLDAHALMSGEMVVNGGRRGLQLVLRPEDLVRMTSAVVAALVR